MRKPLGKSILYSLAAMALGWIVCNILLLVIYRVRFPSNPMNYSMVLGIAAYTGMVIFAAWLFLFFPAFYFVPMTSRLWNPLPAALLGAGCGFLTLYTPFLFLYLSQTAQPFHARMLYVPLLEKDIWGAYAAALCTGLTAALFSALIKNKIKNDPA